MKCMVTYKGITKECKCSHSLLNSVDCISVILVC